MGNLNYGAFGLAGAGAVWWPDVLSAMLAVPASIATVLAVVLIGAPVVLPAA